MTDTTNRPAAVSRNPAEDRRFRQALRRHVDRLAATVTTRPDQPLPGRPSSEAETEQRTRIAAAWVYMSGVAVWAEDHDLVRPLLRSGPPGAVRNTASSLLWLGRAFEQLTVHPATQWLMHPAYQPDLWAGTPNPQAASDLIDWWATEAPSLFYPSLNGQPASISGWPIGDLLTVLSDQRRLSHALVPTPYYVADFILDRTLLPAADEFRGEPLLRTIDPACGTGNFLIRMVDYLWPWYTTGVMTPHAVHGQPSVTGGTIHPPGKAIRLILAGVDGVDIDPLVAAVARLRMTVYIGHLMVDAGLLPGSLRLASIPATVTPRIAVGDALLLNTGITRSQYAQVHPRLVDLPGAAFPLADFTWPTEPPATT